MRRWFGMALFAIAMVCGLSARADDTDDKFTQQFTTAGTVEYYCAIHPMMTGKIVVTP